MKIASRYLLPLEILMGVLMLSWGMSGWHGGGRLWEVLHKADLNHEWGFALCGVGLAQLVVSFGEWLAGRHWQNGTLLVTTRLRFWLALVSMVIWIYVCYFMLLERGAAGMVFSLSVQAPVAAIFAAWIAVSNLKVSVLLDPDVPTARLQRQFLAERERLVRDQ